MDPLIEKEEVTALELLIANELDKAYELLIEKELVTALELLTAKELLKA